MPTDTLPRPELCNCLAVRQAARHVSQFYDQFLAPLGLRTSQFSILSRLKRHGPMTINVLADALVMDRTTLGRNILPLQREGLIAITRGRSDRRSKELCLTERGIERWHAAMAGWSQAQAGFEAAFGADRAGDLRAILHDVVSTDLNVAQGATPGAVS